MSLKSHRNKNLRRPVKSAAEKLRRQKLQTGRLKELGVAEEQISKLNAKEVRLLLRHPKQVAAKSSAA